MAKSEFPMPDLSNATAEFLIEQIYKERKKQKEGKFYEGLYKGRLATMKLFEGFKETGDPKDRQYTTPAYIAQVSFTYPERIDGDAVKAAFTRDELIERKFLKVSDKPQETLRITPNDGSVDMGGDE